MCADDQIVFFSFSSFGTSVYIVLGMQKKYSYEMGTISFAILSFWKLEVVMFLVSVMSVFQKKKISRPCANSLFFCPLMFQIDTRQLAV